MNSLEPKFTTESLSAFHLYSEIQSKIEALPLGNFSFSEDENQLRDNQIKSIIKQSLLTSEKQIQKRVSDEFFGYGPLESLLEDETLSEILVNNLDAIWYEKNGELRILKDRFFSDLSYRNIIEKISQNSGAHITLESPYFDGVFREFRLAMVGPGITRQRTQFSLRRHPKNPWTLEKLVQGNWCSERQAQQLEKIFFSKENFIVVGPTSSGKTSVLNALLNLTPENQRILVIEDTPELKLPNSAGSRLLTREDPQRVLPSISQEQLVRTSLRLRPDRIVMGEMRGGEAKDFLMALATGHRGSFGSLHAEGPQQALLRLEMLIQLGAPQWSLEAVRKLIFMSLNYIIVTKSEEGHRRLHGIYKINSLEQMGFTLDNLFNSNL